MGTKFKEILPVTFFGEETKELEMNSTKKPSTFKWFLLQDTKWVSKQNIFFSFHQTMKPLNQQ